MLLTVASTTITFAQSNDIFKKIPLDLLRQDFLLMRDTLQKVHAGLYRYKTKAEMDFVFDSCFAAIKDSMTVTDFYAITSYVIAAIEDGHTNCKLPGDIAKAYLGNVKVFPAMVMFINNRAFVFCCKQNDDLTGAEIVAVNGHPMDEIVQKLFKYLQSDGGIQSHKNWELPDNFYLLYGIVYGTTDRFSVTYKTKAREIKTGVLQADVLKNFICPSPFKRPEKYLQLTYKPGNIAVLTIQTFFDGFLDNTHENFGKFLDSAFNDINSKHAKKLIIDIRGNQGGNDGNGIMLYSYLTGKPFMYYAAQETVSEKFVQKDHSNLWLQQPKQNNFVGEVFILANGRSFSASAEFSAIAKSNGRARFIGEECGGGYYGNTSGDDANVTLPNSQIICRVPMVKYTSAVKKVKGTDRGVIPDYPVYPTINDIIEHKDSQMEYAVKIVTEK